METAIAYCADSNLRIPATVSIVTMLKNLDSAFSANVVLYQDGWTPTQVADLKERVVDAHRKADLVVRKVDLAKYRSLRKFGGSLMPYCLFDMPQEIDAERFCYLDADTLPLCDVSGLLNIDLEGKAIGGVAWDVEVGNCLERELFLSLGMDIQCPILNTGVVVFDTSRWRNMELTAKCFEFARNHSEQLLAADQTVMNGVITGNFCKIPRKYNVRMGPRAAKYNGNGIVHFVGRPKPWSLRAVFKHRNRSIWKKACAAVGIRSILQF
jgi:lipopolysaccharide biosynthesis glycosyltransferase